MKQSYAIIGSGAVGGLYGAWLARAGHDVHFLAHSDFDHIKKYGLRIDSIRGNFTIPHVNVYKSVDTIPPCDVILIALKTTANDILQSILPILSTDKNTILVMQNGLGTEYKIASIVHHTRIMGALCFVCSHKIGPGHIKHLDFGHFSIGKFSQNGAAAGISEDMIAIQDDFTNAGVKVTLAPDLVTARFKKLVWNVPYNGLSVVLRTTTDTLNANASTRKLVARLMREVCLIATACGHPIEDSYVADMLSYTDSMKPYITSMKLDFDAHRPLEVESIVGEPLRKGQELGLSLPCMTMLYEQLVYLNSENT